MKSSVAVQPAISAEPSRQHRRAPTGIGEPTSNYSKVPNELDYLYTGNKIGGLIQSQIIWFLIRETWGHESRREWAPVSIRKMGQLCGGVDHPSVLRSFKDLAKRGIIAVQKGRGCTALKLYKLTVDNWKNAPAYEPTVQLLNDEAAPEEDDEAEPDDPARPDSFGGNLILRPNRKGRVVPARIEPKDREPVDFRLRFANTCSHSMQVCASAKADLLLITIRDSEPEANKKRITGSSQAPSISQTVENTQATDYRIAISNICLNIWEKAADAKLIESVIRAAGAAPVEIFQRLADKKLSGRDAARRHSSGLLIELAKDAAKTHEAVKHLAKPEKREAPPLPPPDPLDPSKPWDKVRNQLQAICSKETYDNWFAYTRQITFDKKSIIVAVPNDGVKAFLESDDDIKQRLIEACSYTRQPEKIVWRVEP